MTYTDIINHYAKKIDATSYLEIGIEKGYNLESIQIARKEGVDVEPEVTEVEGATVVVGDSLDYLFNRDKRKYKFDIVFIDGLHIASHVKQELELLKPHLSNKALIFLHDIEPPNSYYARPHKKYKEGEGWCGDVWKAFWESDIGELSTFDLQYGLGMIDTTKTKQTNIKIPKRYIDVDVCNKQIRRGVTI